jgi:hypothetical protein
LARRASGMLEHARAAAGVAPRELAAEIVGDETPATDALG